MSCQHDEITNIDLDKNENSIFINSETPILVMSDSKFFFFQRSFGFSLHSNLQVFMYFLFKDKVFHNSVVWLKGR